MEWKWVAGKVDPLCVCEERRGASMAFAESMPMRARKLILRCYAERQGDLWLAFCLDFSLGAQGDSFTEARAKLDVQIREYVRDAMAGADRAHADALLTRRAPLIYWLKYWVANMQNWLARQVHMHRRSSSRPFRETIPLVPAAC